MNYVWLNAIKTILDTKTQTQTLSLTPEQRIEIIESQKEIESGLFVEQAELDKEFNKWLSGKLKCRINAVKKPLSKYAINNTFTEYLK